MHEESDAVLIVLHTGGKYFPATHEVFNSSESFSNVCVCIHIHMYSSSVNG